MSNGLPVDLHVECIDATEGIDHVIIYILAMLQWSKVSLATVLITFYCYFASDDRKCIHYCTHCRKLNAFIILHVILDFLCFTTNVTPSVRPSQIYNPCVYVDAPLPCSLIANTATQLLGGNLLRNSFDIRQTWDTEWFKQYTIKYIYVRHMHIFWLDNIFLT